MVSDGNLQKHVFLDGEGDAYFHRNRERGIDVQADPILRVMRLLKIRATSILEIGCGACDRLASIRDMAQVKCFGIDPSTAAIEHARKRFPELCLEVGTADALPFSTDSFDLVIFGFCLYLVDPVDYFSVSREADRVLKDRGVLLIYDFCTPSPYANNYAHADGVVSRKSEWSRMFTWNPVYSLVHREFASQESVELSDMDGRITVDVLVKNVGAAFPTGR